MKRCISLFLVAIMFIAVVSSCDAIDVKGRIKVASDQLTKIDQRLQLIKQEEIKLTQARFEVIGRLKELQSIYNEQQQALEAAKAEKLAKEEAEKAALETKEVVEPAEPSGIE